MGRDKGVFLLSLIAFLALAICAPVTSALANDPGNITAIEVNPQTPSTVYVATAQAGVLKTTDNGATWTAKNAGLPTRTINDLAVDPFVPHNIYIATDSGAFRSENHGETWSAMNIGGKGVICSALTVDPDTPGILYVGTQVNGVYASVDYGQTWKIIPESGKMKGINGLAVLTVDNPQTQGVGTSSIVKVFKTMYVIDKDGVWKNILGVIGRYNEGVWSLEQEWNKADIANKNLIYTILARASIFVEGQKVVTIGVHEGGLYLNKEGTNEWIKIETPQPNANINGLAGEPQSENPGTSFAPSASNQSVLYAASFDGYVMRGVYDGASWTWNNVLDAGILGVGEVHPKVVTTVAVYGENGAVQTPPPLWVGTFAYNQPGTVYYSPDGGANWSNVLAGGWSE